LVCALAGCTQRVNALQFVSIKPAEADEIPPSHDDFVGRDDVLLITFSTPTDLRAVLRDVDTIWGYVRVTACPPNNDGQFWYGGIYQNGVEIHGRERMPPQQKGRLAEYSIPMRYGLQEGMRSAIVPPMEPDDLCFVVRGKGYGPVARSFESNVVTIPKKSLVDALASLRR
jgi:hypothetical protein